MRCNGIVILSYVIKSDNVFSFCVKFIFVVVSLVSFICVM